MGVFRLQQLEKPRAWGAMSSSRDMRSYSVVYEFLTVALECPEPSAFCRAPSIQATGPSILFFPLQTSNSWKLLSPGKTHTKVELSPPRMPPPPPRTGHREPRAGPVPHLPHLCSNQPRRGSERANRATLKSDSSRISFDFNWNRLSRLDFKRQRY